MKIKLNKEQIEAIIQDPVKAEAAGVKVSDPWWVIVLKVVAYAILLPLSRRNPFWGLLGAGVPPLLGALTLFAYWGALKVFNYSLLSTHYSLIKGFPFSAFRFPFSTKYLYHIHTPSNRQPPV